MDLPTNIVIEENNETLELYYYIMDNDSYGYI